MDKKSKYLIVIVISALSISGSIITFHEISLQSEISYLKKQVKELENQNTELIHIIDGTIPYDKYSNTVIPTADNLELEPLFGMKVTEHVSIKKTTTSETKYVTYENEFSLLPGLDELYNEVGLFYNTQKTAVVNPIFTASAYSQNGFYDYYRGECDSRCLTVGINYNFNSYTSSVNGLKILQLLGYSIITDIDIDTNPDILRNYDKVILLHNEYVTRKEFDAITQHPKVIHLYPNALYAEITVNYDENSITLVRGHGYPTPDISNGFDWTFDNSKLEYNTDCHDWKFSQIDNGYMLNCYPEFRLFNDKHLLKAIKEL